MTTQPAQKKEGAASRQTTAPNNQPSRKQGKVIQLFSQTQSPPFQEQSQSPFFAPLAEFKPEILDYIRANKELTLAQRGVLRSMIWHGGQDGDCFPGNALIAKEAGIDERTVRKCKIVLIKKWIIVREGPGKRRSCSYFFPRAAPFWAKALGDQSLRRPPGPVYPAQEAGLSGPEGQEDRPAEPPKSKTKSKSKFTTTTTARAEPGSGGGRSHSMGKKEKAAREKEEYTNVPPEVARMAEIAVEGLQDVVSRQDYLRATLGKFEIGEGDFERLQRDYLSSQKLTAPSWNEALAGIGSGVGEEALRRWCKMIELAGVEKWTLPDVAGGVDVPYILRYFEYLIFEE